MLFDNNREALRRRYYLAWQKALNKQPIEPLDQQIIDVIAMHPEYHQLLENETATEKDYLPENGETNPFLHMGLHLGLCEQLQTNRPAGIVSIYQQLCQQCKDMHEAQHQMMECLAETIWHAQRVGGMPDEVKYVGLLKGLLVS